MGCVNTVRALSFYFNRVFLLLSVKACVPADLTGYLFHLSTVVERLERLIIFVPCG